MDNLKFNESSAIVTNMMIETNGCSQGPTGGKIVVPGSDKEPDSIAFVQCAGSRDEKSSRILFLYLLYGYLQADELRPRAVLRMQKYMYSISIFVLLGNMKNSVKS